MRRIVAVSAMTTFALTWASSSPGEGPGAKPASLEQVLDAWQAKAETFNTLSVTFTRRDASRSWGDTVEYQGQIFLQEPNLACIHFRKVDAVARTAADHERIVFAGEEIRQYDFNTRQIFVWPPAKTPRAKDDPRVPFLFQPFLFRTKAEDVKRPYNLTLVGETGDSYLIGVRPRPEQNPAGITSAFLQLGKTTMMP
ncbi:MAG TPA: hypothetical protein VGH33_21195, partial [Isosphaeraceae bacterium]